MMHAPVALRLRRPRPVPFHAPLRALAGALGVLTLLAGCGLIPAQPVTNPLGLDGAPLAVRITGDDASVLASAAVGSASASGSFGDISTPIAPGRFALEQPLAGSATVSAPALTELPDTITLSDLSLDVTVRDAQNSATFALSPSAGATLTRDGGSSYAVSEVAFSTTLTGAQLRRLNPILTGGGSNSVSATLSLTATSTPDLPAGSSIELTFANGSGSVGF